MRSISFSYLIRRSWSKVSSCEMQSIVSVMKKEEEGIFKAETVSKLLINHIRKNANYNYFFLMLKPFDDSFYVKRTIIFRVK
jgi:hypothetical protein